MNQPFEISADGKVRIVGGAIIDNAQPLGNEKKLAEKWSVAMVKNPNTGHFYSAGFKLSQ
ncbi:hypothetical protein ACYZT4_10565 [Pseudomonas sp. GB2N2]